MKNRLDTDRRALGARALLPALGLALAGAAPALAQDAAAAAPVEASATAQVSSEFGEPLVVNGKRISDLAIKRYLVYGPGQLGLQARKLQILMDHERMLRREEVRGNILDEGVELADAEMEAEIDRRMARFVFDQEAVDRRLGKEKDSFQGRYPTLDYEVELRRAYRSGAWYRDQVRQTTEFDQLFFPDHPETWPELAIEAINQGSPDVDLVDDYRIHYERRKAEAEANGTPIEPEQEMMMSILRDFVMGALWSLAEVKTATQGISEDLVMVIEGGDWRAEIKTEDVYQEMKHVFSAQDVEDAKLALALMTATEQKLESEGILMPIDEFRTMIADLRQQSQSSMFNMDFLALQGHGFPSSEAYERHLRVKESFRRAFEDDVAMGEDGTVPEMLREHLPVANTIMGLAKAHADTLLVSAFDFPSYEWKENGWQESYDRAQELRSKVDAQLAALAADAEKREAAEKAGETYESEAVPFDQWWQGFLSENSDYWDPPLPVSGKGPPAYSLKNYGAFQDEPMTRNDMKRAIGESEYEHFLANDAVVDKMFQDLEPGQVGGPYRGPHGYYIVYLKRRIPATQPLNVRRDQHYKMLAEDWLRVTFRGYMHDALDEAQISGL
ncbi:MAG: hypothetical protein AAFP22_12095 [Planctomycetota bacterium]